MVAPEAEEEAAEQGQEEELEVAVLSLLLAGGEELLEHLRVGELRATRQVHRDRAGLDAGHVGGRRRCVWTVRRRSAAARCLWRGKVDAVEVTRVRVRGGVARPTDRFALSKKKTRALWRKSNVEPQILAGGFNEIFRSGAFSRD
jgi:hypothetical protein